MRQRESCDRIVLERDDAQFVDPVVVDLSEPAVLERSKATAVILPEQIQLALPREVFSRFCRGPAYPDASRQQECETGDGAEPEPRYPPRPSSHGKRGERHSPGNHPREKLLQGASPVFVREGRQRPRHRRARLDGFEQGGVPVGVAEKKESSGPARAHERDQQADRQPHP